MNHEYDWWDFQYEQIGQEIMDGSAYILAVEEGIIDGIMDRYTVLYHGHIHTVVV